MTPYASAASSSPSSAAAMTSALASRYGAGGGAGSGLGGFAASLAEDAARPAQPVGAVPVPVGSSRPAMMAMNAKSELQTRAAIHKSAHEFEASVLGQLMGFMTQNVEVDPTFGGGHGEEMFRDMMNAEYGKMMNKSGRTGIADQVERQLLRAQGLKPLKGPPAKG